MKYTVIGNYQEEGGGLYFAHIEGDTPSLARLKWYDTVPLDEEGEKKTHRYPLITFPGWHEPAVEP